MEVFLIVAVHNDGEESFHIEGAWCEYNKNGNPEGFKEAVREAKLPDFVESVEVVKVDLDREKFCDVISSKAEVEGGIVDARN